MPSINPDRTARHNLPSPTPPDPPDVPGDVKALAEAVDAAIPIIETGTINVPRDTPATLTFSKFTARPTVMVQAPSSNYVLSVYQVSASQALVAAQRHDGGTSWTTLSGVQWIAVQQ